MPMRISTSSLALPLLVVLVVLLSSERRDTERDTESGTEAEDPPIIACPTQEQPEQPTPCTRRTNHVILGPETDGLGTDDELGWSVYVLTPVPCRC